jgi:anti-sigma B factor antagonist
LSKVDISPEPEAASSPFSITCQELDEHTSVVSVEGELDLTTAPRLKWMLLDTLQEGRNRLIVDLSATTFMDSTALGVLVVVNRRLEPSARMAILCDRPVVLKIFELSGMDGAFTIVPSIEEARAYVRSGSAEAR